MRHRVGTALVVNFTEAEFKNPNQMDSQFLLFLDAVRQQCSFPFFITSDGRDPQKNKEVGGVPTSLHLFDPVKGLKCRAVDFTFDGIEKRPWTKFFAIAKAVVEHSHIFNVSPQLELVYSVTDKHVHLGAFREFRLGELIVSVE